VLVSVGEADLEIDDVGAGPVSEPSGRISMVAQAATGRVET
jgi:hypothetical protein